MQKLQDFKRELLNCHTKEMRVHFLRKFILHGLPYVFQNDTDYFEFRQIIGQNFNVGFQEVQVLGSAKLGYSYWKEKEFNYESDIDVVIINEKLFEKYSKLICDFQYKLDKNKKVPTQNELRDYSRFLKYMIKGWMRPDLLPVSFQLEAIKSEWFNFFNSISYGKSKVGNYKVTCGLYKSYDYLEMYQINSIEQKYNKLITK